MNRREFSKKLLGLGAAFSAGTLVLPAEVKSHILKPMIDGYCRSYWDSKVCGAIRKVKREAPGYMIGDIHLHSVHSDGKYPVLEILSRAHLLGLDYIVLTEHVTPDYYDVESPVASIRDQRESVKRLQDRGINPPEIYPGAEISTSEGHLIALFPKAYLNHQDFFSEFRLAFSSCGEKYRDAEWVISRIKNLGGKTIVPHPNMTRRDMPFGISTESLDTHLAGLPDGIEDMNTGNNCYEQYGERFGLASTGASDAHFKALMGTSVTMYGAEYDDLTEAIADKATTAFQTIQVSQPLLKASHFYYSLRM